MTTIIRTSEHIPFSGRPEQVPFAYFEVSMKGLLYTDPQNHCWFSFDGKYRGVPHKGTLEMFWSEEKK